MICGYGIDAIEAAREINGSAPTYFSRGHALASAAASWPGLAGLMPAIHDFASLQQRRLDAWRQAR
ncbi:MAG: hypothetical protein ACJ77Q_01455, partial [Gemmatimonadaceae bacterium]